MNRDEFIAGYGEFIYKSSYKCYMKLRGKPHSEDETDLICDVAVKVIETFSTKIEEQILNFRGESEFSSFLFGAVYNSMREILFGKTYYPSVLKPYDDTGRAIYNLRYVNNYPRKEALELVCQETGLPWKEVNGIDKEIAARLKTTIVRKGFHISRGEILEDQMDRIVSDIRFGEAQTPENEALRGELRVKLISILQNLKPHYRRIIILRFIEEQDTEYIRNTLGLKNSQAVHNLVRAARRAFIREAEKQHLDLWMEQSCKGVDNERKEVFQ